MMHAAKIQRGYIPGQRRHEGHLYLMHTNDGFPYIWWAVFWHILLIMLIVNF